MKNHAPCIPERALDLQLRLCVEAHCRSAGHRACEATLDTIKEYVVWATIAKDVNFFALNFLHCVATIPGDKVPCPPGTQLHATKPNEILHFNFLYTGLSRGGKYKYILLLKDNMSDNLWLLPCCSTDAVANVDELMRWFAGSRFVLL
jgi:Integrase zinc binding domain